MGLRFRVKEFGVWACAQAVTGNPKPWRMESCDERSQNYGHSRDCALNSQVPIPPNKPKPEVPKPQTQSRHPKPIIHKLKA